MTTKRQIAKLVGPLLEQNPDLVPDGHWLYLKPVRHLLRTLLIDRTGSANNFSPRWAVIILFDPRERIDRKYGRILSGRRGYNWFWSDPEVAAVLYDAIDRQAIPVMRSIDTIGDFVSYTSFPDRIPAAQELPYVRRLKWADRCGAG